MLLLLLVVAFQHTALQGLKCSRLRPAFDSLFVIRQVLLEQQFCSFAPDYLNLIDLVELVLRLFVY